MQALIGRILAPGLALVLALLGAALASTTTTPGGHETVAAR